MPADPATAQHVRAFPRVRITAHLPLPCVASAFGLVCGLMGIGGEQGPHCKRCRGMATCMQTTPQASLMSCMPVAAPGRTPRGGPPLPWPHPQQCSKCAFEGNIGTPCSAIWSNRQDVKASEDPKNASSILYSPTSMTLLLSGSTFTGALRVLPRARASARTATCPGPGAGRQHCVRPPACLEEKPTHSERS